MITLLKIFPEKWEQAKGYLRLDLEAIEAAMNQRWSATFGASNLLNPDTIQGWESTQTRYISNEATSPAAGWPMWAQVNLANGVKNRLPFSNFVAATDGSKLVGRGSGAAGDFEEISIGTGLVMQSTTLSVDLSGLAGRFPIPDEPYRDDPWPTGGVNSTGVIATAFTAGSIIFAGPAGVLAQDNANLFYDDTNNRVGLGTVTPGYQLDIRSATVGTRFHMSGTTGDIGAYISAFASGAATFGTAAFDGSNWRAKIATGALVSCDSLGSIVFLSNTGLVAGNTFTPTTMGSVYASGTIAFGSATAETFSDVGGTTVYPVLAGAGTISKSGASDRPIGMYSKFTASNTAPARAFRGYVIITNASGTMGSANCYTGTIEVTGSSNITETNFIGGGLTLNNGSCTIATHRGIDIQAPTVTAGTLTSQCGIRINALTQATNNTSLLIGQANNPTGNFGIYSASTYDSYFAGEVGFGTTTPTAPIHISKTQSVVSAAGMRITAGNDTAVAGQLYAIQAIVNCSHTTGTTTSVEGINFTAEYRGTSATSPAVTTMMGILARTGMDDTPGGGQVSGTITTGIALRAGSIINQATVGTPAVTYTNQIGVRIDNQGDTTVGGGSGLTITNAAGLVVALQTGAVTSNANVVIGQSTIPSGTWSIYNVSTRENYFAGPILIGGTTAAGGGTNYISFENGTAVTATAANTSALYAADTAAGDSNLFATNEQDYVTQLTGLDIAKTDDESVANNTPQNDDHLLVNLPATSRYYFKFYLFATSPATAGLLLQLDGTAGVSSLKANISIYDSTGALVAFGRKTAFNSSTGVDFTGDAYAVIEGTIEVSTAGTFRLEWAQNTTDAGNATVLQENSSLTLRRLNA